VQLLFLDEPTSGLDSFSSFNLVSLLKNLSARSTILLTIHQPSSETFFLFDNVIFMKSGRVLYHGAVPAIVPHFHKLGHHCPSNFNPADFVMSLSQTESVEELEKTGGFMPILPELLADTSEAMTFADNFAVFTAERSFVTQMMALLYREFINSKRDTGSLIGRFIISAILNFLFALIFLNAGGRGNDTLDDFNSHFGAIAMVLISGMFASAQSVMLSFPIERPMFLREYSTGTCKAYVLRFFCLLT
jgi:hypothetical protein